jgi:hypothetical protein
MRLREFAPAGGGGSGDYFQALASAWYNGVFDTGSLQKGIKSQEDVERLLNRGIVCPDGKTRKLHIDYNSDFDGVEIYSDDYYEYGDHDATIDSRTGQKWGPYDFMAFSDEDLSEGLNEFAADGGDGGGEDDALRNYARMWWAGDDATQQQIERALAKMGWEIGEDEGGYDNGGVFVVRAGDENGDSYTSWAAEDLTEGNVINENSDVLAGLTDILKIAASRQTPQNPRYFAQQVKDVALQLKDNPATQKWSNYLDGVVRWADVISSGKEQYSPGFADEVHNVLGPATRAYQDALLNKQGMAEGNDPWGPEGRFVGDTGPAQITTTVARVQLKPGDKVLYKPTEQRATIEALSKDGTKARIHISSPMGGRTFNCKTADLKALGALKEKSTSQAQFRTMAAAAHDPKFARKVGIKQSVAREFNKADKGQSYKSLPKRAD